MSESKTKAFIAVDIPQDIKSKIVEVSKSLDSGSIKLVGLEQLHITLFFLGYVDAEQLEAVKRILSSVRASGFAIDLNGMGTFDARNPRVVFVNITQGAEELKALYSSLYNSISALHIKLEEREFTPHVTIARVKKFTSKETGAVTALIKSHSNYDFGSFLCTSMTLKESVPAHGLQGPLYRSLYVKSLPAVEPV